MKTRAAKPIDAVASKTRKQRKPKKQKPIYGPAFGAWIKGNVLRDIRSGALWITGDGRTLH